MIGPSIGRVGPNHSSAGAVRLCDYGIVGNVDPSAPEMDAVMAILRLPIHLSPAIRADIFGRHQSGIVTKRCEFAAQVMCADAGFHADQARRYIGEPRFHLATRPLLPQHDGAARIVAHDVERVLPISMPITAIAVLGV
jgi:hypothetical protein